VSDDGFQDLQHSLVSIRDTWTAASPIYQYYFPRTWTAVLARFLGLSPRPNFRLYSAELAAISQRTQAAMSAAGQAFKEIEASGPLPASARQFATLVYNQVRIESEALLAFTAHIQALMAQDPLALHFVQLMQQRQREAEANRAQLILAGPPRFD